MRDLEERACIYGLSFLVHVLFRTMICIVFSGLWVDVSTLNVWEVDFISEARIVSLSLNTTMLFCG